MKEKMKQVYLTPAVQVKMIAVENGFTGSFIGTVGFQDGTAVISF
jgi:hypothetical protein